MMDQFVHVSFVYAGYTMYVIMELDSEGYMIAEHTIRSVSNNIRLSQR